MNADEFYEKLNQFKKMEDLDGIISYCPKNFPYPDAFKSMAIALRKKIRQSKKNGEDFKEVLIKLYKIACYHRIVCQKHTVLIDGEEIYLGYSVAKLAHQEGISKKLKFNYRDLGYKFLDLLNPSDCKLIKEVFGEPNSHKDPRKNYLQLWPEYIEQIKKKYSD